MAAEPQPGPRGDRDLGLSREPAVHLEGLAAEGLDRHAAPPRLHQASVTQTHGQVGQLDVAVGAAADAGFAAVDVPCADDVSAPGALRDLSEGEAHAGLTSRRRR